MTVPARLLTVPEAADVLRLSVGAVYQLIRADVLPACHVGRALRLSEDALATFVAAGGRAWPGGWRKTSHTVRA
jgi:excisionase family DNA binding protein